ncbi:MAG: DNA-directed RNA polymerase subunit H [Nanoarchaeota archaeon]
MAEKETEQIKHVLVPEHTKLSDKERQAVLDKYRIQVNDLPYILITDPAIRHLEPKVGDVFRIDRASASAGTTVFYRVVVND